MCVFTNDKLLTAINKVDIHDHICSIYETKEEQIATIVPYIKKGLENNEKCIYIADENPPEDVIEFLAKDIPNLYEALTSGALSVINKNESYLQNGSLDPDWMVSFLADQVEFAKTKGYKALRVTGEASFALGNDLLTSQLIEYEAKVNRVLENFEVSAVCQYNKKSFAPEIVKSVIETHPIVVYKGTVCKNYHYIPTDEFLNSRNETDEATRMLDQILLVENYVDSLKESEERFKSAIRNAPLPIMLYDSNRNVLEVNDIWQTLTGYTIDQIPTMDDWLEKAYGNRKENIRKKGNEKYSKLERSELGEFLIDTNFGTQRIWEFTSSPLGRLPDGRKLFTLMAVDVTEKNKAQQNLLKQKEEQLNLLNTIPAFVFLMDCEDKMLWMNSLLLKKMNLNSVEEIKGRSVFEFHSEEIAGNFSLQNRKVIQTKVPLSNLIHEETDNGKKKWFSVEKLPYFDNEGKVIGVLGFAFEITELKEKEAELTEAKNRAEQADNLKTEFLAQISHEVRSPINTILNYVSLIKEITQDVKDEDLIYGFNAIDSSSRRLIRTIDLILNMSQLQTGKLDLNIKNLNIECDVLKPVIKELKNSAESKGLTFIYSTSVKDKKVKVDQYTVTQIFVNLIENAIKYTRSGSIKISDSIINGKLEISVADTGIGIASEFLPFLFDPFRQEEQGYTRKYEGNGLGLALVKKYCELNNAQIKVESEKGIGSTFTVSFNL